MATVREAGGAVRVVAEQRLEEIVGVLERWRELVRGVAVRPLDEGEGCCASDASEGGG